MPLVQFVDVTKNVRITKDMGTPKKGITRTAVWYRRARKVIPEIPDVASQECYIEYEEITEEWIRFDLRLRADQRRQYLIIFRHRSTI